MHWLVPSYGVTVVELLVVAAVALLVVVAGVVVLVRRRRARLAPVAEYDAVGRPVQPDAAEDDPSTGDRLERLAAPVETEAAPRVAERAAAQAETRLGRVGGGRCSKATSSPTPPGTNWPRR